MNHSLKVVALVAAMALGAQAHATFAFDNFSAGQTFNTGSGKTISGAASAAGTAWTQGAQFTSLASGILDNITIAYSHVSGTNTGGVELFNDSGINTVGTLITSWGFGASPAFGGAFAPRVLTNAFPAITLTAGSKYWVVASPGASDSWNVWNNNTSGSTLPRAFSHDGGATWGYDGPLTSGAFSVEVIVPEPGTFVALSVGALFLLRRFRKR